MKAYQEEPIRILHMIGSLNMGGSQTMIINLYKAMDRSKIQFDFILDHPDQDFFRKEVEMLGARIFEMPSFTGKNFFEIKKAWNKFFDSHPEYKILHSHVRSYASIYIPIAKKHGIKTIIHSHSTSNGFGVKSLGKNILQFPLRFQADFFMACSENAGKWLFGRRVTKGEKFFVLKNAIDLSQYKYDATIRTRVRQSLGIDETAITFIQVGRLVDLKNQVFSLEAFYSASIPNSKLIFVGDGPGMENLKSKVAEYELGSKVIFLGNRIDVPDLLMAGDCSLIPSKWEGLGISAIESQAVGIKTICSDALPLEVAITELCVFLPLDISLWITEMQTIKPIRLDVKDAIIKGGYSINETSKDLYNFYMNMEA